MQMLFGQFIKLVYIKGYFEKGYVNNKEYKEQPFFVVNLLKGSVKYPDLISVSEASINGYLKGDSIGTLVQALRNAEFDIDICSNYLKSLYKANHKDTKTYRERYKGKTYKEALFEQVVAILKDTSQDNMSMDLALLFKNIIDTSSPKEILQEKSQIQDIMRKVSTSTNKANLTNESDDSLETKMDMLLNTLITTGREIAEFKPTGIGDYVRYSRLMGTLKNDFEQLLTLSKLLPQNTIDHNSSIFNDIRCSVQSLTAENFILSTSQFMIESLRNYHIHRLSELLRKAQEKN